MSSSIRLLSGQVEDSEIVRLRHRIAQLEEQLGQSDEAIVELRAQLASANRSLAPLQKELLPFKRVIDRIFGIMDAAGAQEDATPSAGKWDKIKQRLTGKDVEVIDLLLVQGAMTVSQIANAIHCSGEAARQRVDKLRGQGLLVKNGRDVTLKP